ncbi:MAG: mechanosensitive ion channel [Actinomycetaceae bacterium]|nr:mechanosensitive ion channel [Actinomycetaceae bacterium]
MGMIFTVDTPDATPSSPIGDKVEDAVHNVVAPAAEKAVEATVDVLAILAGTLIGAVAGIVAAFVVYLFMRAVKKLHPFVAFAIKRGKIPGTAALMIFGGAIGLEYTAYGMHTENANWVSWLSHALWIVGILALTWLGTSLVNILDDLTQLHYKDVEPGRVKRLTTQAQVLGRVLQAIIVIIGVVCVILTFPQARPAVGSFLASAGLLSLIAGLAAQSSLSNMFAGIQIAFTDAIRVDDIVVVNGASGTVQGAVEEITMTYVVVRAWDDRRLIIPSTKFTTEPFENWTRRASQLLGTVVLDADWRLPVSKMREEVERLLQATDLWDERTFNIQVVNAEADRIKVRIVVSAANSGNLWDLSCYIRENLVTWVKDTIPDSLPTTRLRLEGPISEKIAEGEAPDSLEEKTGSEGAQPHAEGSRKSEKHAQADATHGNDKEGVARREIDPELQAAIMAAAKSRRSVRSKLDDFGAKPPSAMEDEQDKSTQGLSVERLYSGSPEAEERGRMMAGPSQEVIDERERTALLRRAAIMEEGEVDEPSATTLVQPLPKGEDTDSKNQR